MAKKIVFCGVGALGSTAAVLCRNVDATLGFIDFDRVESKNILAQNYVRQSIGKNKAQALKLQFSNFYSIKTDAFGVKLIDENIDTLLKDCDLIVDCFDNLQSRKLLSEYSKTNNKALLHAAISADGTFGIVRWDEHFVPDEESREGQATCEGGEHLPLIGLLAAALARSIQDYLDSGYHRGYVVSLNGVAQTHT